MSIRYPNWSGKISAWIAAMLIGLAGCNGSGTNVADGGGIGGSGISFGVITGFGSVIVNGKRFDTDDAIIVVDGIETTQAALTEGMVARVEGEWTANGEGVANRVEYDDDIRGPVQGAVQYDALSGQGSMTVLGQLVRFNRQSVFRGTSPTTVGAGDYLRISGWYQESGELIASLVQSIGVFIDGNDAEVNGFIRNLDTALQQFLIGDVPVSWDSATEIAMGDGRDSLLPADDGVFVEVEGHFVNGVLEAGKIKREDGRNRIRATSGDDIDLEGPISSRDAAGRTLVIHGVTVRITDSTQFRDTLTENQLQNGLRVEVQGEWNGAQELIARVIDSRAPDSEIEASILTITDPANRVLNVGGIRVLVVSRTLLTDDDDDHLTFTDLRAGDFLEVIGIRREDANGIYVEAVRIERDDDDDDDFELTGRVDGVDSAAIRFFILGVAMNVDGNTEWDDGLDSINDL